MKKHYFLILFTLFISYGFSQTVTIPDATFKTALLGNSLINTNMDSEIQVTEAQLYTGAIDVQGLSISDYTGLEAFVNITSFDGKFNDVSSIDVSALTKLVTLDLGANTTLTALNVSTNLLLENLLLAECFALTTLTFGNNAVLATLNLREAGTTVVDFSTLTALKDLDMNSTGLGTAPPSSLDFSNNVNLETVVVRHSNVTTLDFSNNNKLTSVEVDFNSMMTSLNLKNGANATITSLIAVNNPALTTVCVDDVTFATNNVGWSSSGTYTATCTLSTDDISRSSIRVFMDQSSGMLRIANAPESSIKGITVYNILGKAIKRTKNDYVDLSNAPRGIYIAKIETSLGEAIVKKILKE